MSQITPDETLLGLLAKRPRHGYELLECFHNPAQLGEVWKLSTSQLYAVLKRLETEGSTIGCAITASDAPTRIEYQITEKGLSRLQRWLDEPAPSASVHRVRVEFLSRLYIGRLLNIPTIPIVQRQKQVCQHKRDELHAQIQQAAPGVGRLTLELVMGQLDVILQWLDRCELIPKDE